MKVGIIGAPVDLGQQRRGVDMGPSAIRIAKLEEGLGGLGHSVRDFGNIAAADMATAAVGDRSARYLQDVVRQCEALAGKVFDAVGRGYFPLVLGGDQSASIGALAGLARSDPRQGIIWLDAHGDFNTVKTTPSGNIHGMALAAILGYGHPKLSKLGGVSPKAVEKNTVLIGGRSFDPQEADAISKSKMTVFTMKDVDELGMRKVISEAIKIAGSGVDNVHLSFDVDVVDPRDAPGTGTPVRGGITYREAHLAMEMLSDSEMVTSAEFVEVNPILDTSNHTAELAVELALSLFGKRIIP
ncbi:MAG: arginase [Thaumarchaeota archaeon]|nr:arginase [Nitrososphaerota archaeon]